jgi:hypothetical protein
MSKKNENNAGETENFEVEETLIADEAEFVEPSHVYGVRG